MSSDKSVESAVKKFIAAKTSLSAGQVQPSTKIQDVLQLNEAQPFMVAFGEKFDVDMSTFRIERHYGPVGPVSILSYLVFLAFFRKSYGFKPLTAEQLFTAARDKVWPAP